MENDLLKIQQRVWRNQLNLLHIKWQEGNERYEDDLKNQLYELEETMFEKGLLRNYEKPKGK